ncbi:MAG: cysteine hydrolase [Prevotellaceae bacterium]|jgi:nicotinamidase-related amidase|nr:cysteine hydrolase [Prevotellaceae bacterium]
MGSWLLMRALIVIDMQDEYVGHNRNRKRFPYNSEQLIKNINMRITDYEQYDHSVIYIKNKGKSERISDFVAGLRLVSDLVFEKNKASCFSNSSLVAYLTDKAVNEIEIAGVDGNSCVGISALDGAKHGFSISLLTSCVGIANSGRFTITKEKLLKANISVL